MGSLVPFTMPHHQVEEFCREHGIDCHIKSGRRIGLFQVSTEAFHRY